VFFEAIESMSHQLWESAEVPIGITDVDMPEVGRQGGETRFYLEPTAVPVQQRLHGEAMKSRLVPIHPSTRKVLVKYLQRRNPNRASNSKIA
jgi:hypothetical protein